MDAETLRDGAVPGHEHPYRARRESARLLFQRQPVVPCPFLVADPAREVDDVRRGVTTLRDLESALSTEFAVPHGERPTEDLHLVP